MDSWRFANLPDFIIKALEKAGFHTPTSIQKCVLPIALKEKVDILGAAPTGSGKTLAYGIPLILKTIESLNLENSNVDFNVIYDKEPVNFTEERSVSDFDSKSSKRKKQERNSDIFSSLDLIEELDADSGKVLTVHSLDEFSPSLNSNSVDYDTSNFKLVNNVSDLSSRVYGLVLLPTRELALQVCQHLRMLTEFCSPSIRIEPIVGGISIDKQIRLLRRSPHIIVATPGRLWQFIEQGETHILTVRDADVLVVDEADRLVEANHFEDLRTLFRWLQSSSMNEDDENPDENFNEKVSSKKKTKKRKHETISHVKAAQNNRQTLVFSATLTFVHSGALKPGTGSKKRKLHSLQKKHMTTKIKLALLRELLGLKKSARVIDLSTICNLSNNEIEDNSNTIKSVENYCSPEGLKEFRLICPDQSAKDVRLFWFLTFGRYQCVDTDNQSMNCSQRCLIFLNSKSGVRRLAGVMRQLMNANAFMISNKPIAKYINILHADMIQKQRLRALERFQDDPYGVLIASDVAARGLDLANSNDINSSGIAWVIHFEVPSTAELYIHRRGRTARANRLGTSILFICPKEVNQWRQIALSLKRTDIELPDLGISITGPQLISSEQIVNLAKQLDSVEHRNSRSQAHLDWFKRAAKDADILLENDAVSDYDDEDDTSRRHNKPKSRNNKTQNQTNILRIQLRQVVDNSHANLLKSSANLPKSSHSSVRLLPKIKLLKQIQNV